MPQGRRPVARPARQSMANTTRNSRRAEFESTYPELSGLLMTTPERRFPGIFGTNTIRFLTDIRESVTRWGSPTDAQRTAVENIFRTNAHFLLRARPGHGYSPLTHGEQEYLRTLEAAQQGIIATSREETGPDFGNPTIREDGSPVVPDLHNGVYTLDNGTQHMTFRIKTRQRGEFAGRRTIAKMASYGEFREFGFLQETGTIAAFRRVRAERNEQYMRWAEIMIRMARARQRTLLVDGPTGADRVTFSLQETRSCIRCNRALTTPTSIEAGIGPECAARTSERTVAAPSNPTPDPSHAEGWTREGGNATVVRSAGRRIREHVLRANGADVVLPPEGDVQLTLSELGTGEVQ